MKHIHIVRSLSTLLLLASCSFAPIVYAESPANTPKNHEMHHPKAEKIAEPTAEMRKSMAEMHQTMADCLKSDRSMSECKQEMMKNCPMMKESGRCAMMGGMDEMMGKNGMGRKTKSSAAE